MEGSLLYTKNREGQRAYDIDPVHDRRDGVSAFVRLANEEEWVGPAIESIMWVDEIVCTLQCSTDRTGDILRSFGSPKIRIYDYPFKSWPNGPGHGEQPGDSLHNNAYFYNWSLSLTRFKWALKWDGDMVAFDWLEYAAQGAMERAEIIKMNGINIVHGLTHMSAEQPFINEMSPRLFRVRPGVHYKTGPFTQNLAFQKSKSEIIDSAYLHFKWAKKFEASHVSWPENWREIPELVRVNERVHPGKAYTGDIPKPLRGIM